MNPSVASSNDVYANIATLDEALLRALVERLELRAADQQQRAMREAYLSEIALPEHAHVLEVGSGTGAVVRELAGHPRVEQIVGIDPSSFFVEKARELCAECKNARFEVADGRKLPFEDARFDAVIFHTTLCHIPAPERALAEAARVVKPGGCVAIFDGDYAGMTVAVRDADPLQTCIQAVLAAQMNDPWIVRRLPALVHAAGLVARRLRIHGYFGAEEPRYFLAIIDSGAQVLTASGQVSPELAETLKAEARRRVEAGTFFALVNYGSIIASRPR